MPLAPKPYPFDFEIPKAVKTRLAHQTPLVRRWAAQEAEAKYYRDTMQLLNSFEYRRVSSVTSENFIDTANKRPSMLNVIKMQGRIAYCVHRLVYVRDGDSARAGGRWHTSESDVPDFPHRAPAYFDPYMDGRVPERISIPKVDVALLGHCFGIPVEVWELQKDACFDHWLREAKDGKDLFSFGGLARHDNSFRWHDLGPAPQPSGVRAPGGVARYVYSPIPAFRWLRLSVDLPAGFETAQVLMFEDDGTNVTLVSTRWQTDFTPLYDGGKFHTPRLPEGGQEEHLPAMWFSPRERTEFITLAVARGASFQLADWPFYANGEEGKVQILEPEDIADLRRKLFALPREQWCVLKKEVEISPDPAVLQAAQ